MKSFLLIGLGHFGAHIARQLNELGHEIMAVDKNEERINRNLDLVTNALIGDATDKEFLRSLGIKNYDVCFVTVGANFADSLEITYILKELGAVCVVSRAEKTVQKKFLLRNGADDVIYPEKQAAIWAAMRYSSKTIIDFIELDNTHSVFEVAIPKEWLGKTVDQINIRKKYNINIIAFKENDNINLTVTPDTVFKEGMTLLVISSYRSLSKCFKL